MARSYERVEISGRSYLVCAGCRRPLKTGHSSLYEVVGDNVPRINDPRLEAQAVCGPCLKVQHEEVYPGVELPDIIDGYLDVSEVPPSLIEELTTQGINLSAHDDLKIWELAIEAARASGGGESVEHAHRRLSGQWEIDVEVTEPV